ncbi:TrbG/VirB9 family P-type conjugative transfer protein [Stenotrophomonas maltophilia]|uniref:TrbG/VirB9 family P-type conjugative transfer protein n=1 Tax=Stenotrophomonas maltophilia TaxID=40324 RepID=UPI0009B2960E|nr:TrbG/VirB9 family P-type conjugative transfer protein [Stenotrophomonas maltophilia]MDH0794610.1 TrbG/VirB9 family P-type conjugative transfer protein [Stenotrophomonas maltophilia]
MKPSKQRSAHPKKRDASRWLAAAGLSLLAAGHLGATEPASTQQPAAATPPHIVTVQRDSRLREIDYNPDQVIDITAHVGYFVHLVFAPGEEPVHGGVVLGDSDAWSFSVAGNNLFLKPKNTDGNTNLTVVTNVGRTYTFILLYAQRRPTDRQLGTALNLRYKFRYPAEELAAAKRATEKPESVQISERLARPEREIRNINYFACGSDDVNPDVIFDDGRFTYMRFLANRELPAIFTVADDGSEVLANSRTASDDPETIIVQRVAKRFVFRRGQTVGCAVNKGFSPHGPALQTGTIDEGVQRVVKGAQTP